MTDNINSTEGLREPEPVEWESYEDAKGGGERVVLPPRASYALLPTAPPEHGATKDGFLQSVITPLVVVAPGQPFDGHEIRFTRVNVKKWPKRNGNGFADYLRSHGYQGMPRSNQEYMEAANALVNHPAHGVVDWEAYCKQCQFTLKGMEKFPRNDDGTYESRIKCPNCSTAENPVWLYANARVVAFTPPNGNK